MKNPLRNVRVVFRRTSFSVKCLVLVTLVFCILALMTLRLALTNTQKNYESARAEAQVLEQENNRLRRSIAQLGTVQSVTDLARDLLDLVDPDTVIFNIGG